jgi:thiol:disulfide interchange protein DsbA
MPLPFLERSAPPELSSTPAPAVAASPLAASPFVAGRDYLVLNAATARFAAAASGKIEVTEFFMFLCFPCYSFEPELDRWEASAPSDVSLTRVPAMFNPRAELQARAYYTAEALGKLDTMQDAFFDEIHERGNALASRAALADFFQRFGVDAATFDATFDSSEVDARMQRAVALNREYGIVATPTVVVAGRYSTNPERGNDAAVGESPWPAMLAVVDQLVAESRACRDRCVERARER